MQETYWAAGIIGVGMVILIALVRVVWMLANLKAMVCNIVTNELPHIRADIQDLGTDFKEHMHRHHET